MAIESGVLLDAIGRKLLAALQEDARLSYAELGRRIGLSPAATAERLRRLEEVGIITGYRVEIDREALGLPVMAIVRLSCDGVKYRPFLKAVQAMERVTECHHVAGGDAFILKVVAGSVEELGRVVEKLLDFGVPTTSIVFSSPVARRALRAGEPIRANIHALNRVNEICRLSASRARVDTLGTPVRDGDCLTEAPDVDEVTTLAHLRLGSPGTRSIAIRPDLATGGRFEILPRP